ncbi:MAG: flavodoxin domain-containing protein [Rhizobiaceae bacterium]
MHVVVIYATVEGQTRKIARNIAGTVQSAGHDVTVFDATDIEDVDLGATDALIVAAPVHVGRYPAALGHWLKANAGAVASIPSAFVSVSLATASAFAEEHREIEAIAAAFTAECGWKPTAVHQAAGALRYLEYDFLKRLLMRQFARKEGGPVDMSKDHEFTDWDALADFVNGFVKAASAA